MTLPPAGWSIEPLSPSHDRSHFDCGNEVLDRYFQTQAGQEARKFVAAPFVLIEKETGRIGGYYTLSASAIDPQAIPPDFAKKMPRYPLLPATLLGRLAVSREHQGKGFGQLLLSDALLRSVAANRDIGSVAMIVDAIAEAAVRFYERFGFRKFPSQDRRLFLPMKTIASLG
ncbi:MAG: GNAT family N-acetyltransferase [Sumerlaeia bacterium]